MATRINKYLSEVGFCSRRAADRLIQEGKVKINGELTEIGTKVEEGDQVEVEGQKKFKIILTQGLNRQIRRMCEALGYRVKSLKRVRIMNIQLDVPTGKYREFTKEELIELNRLLENSSKTYF